jgi:hypothetical protein
MTAKRILLIVAVLALVCCAGGAFVVWQGAQAALNLAKPVLDTTEGFMSALKAGDFQKAYDLTTPELQSSVGGTVDGFKEALTSQGIDSPAAWTFSKYDASASGSVTTWTIGGTGTYGGATKNITLVLEQGAKTLVAGYNVK